MSVKGKGSGLGRQYRCVSLSAFRVQEDEADSVAHPASPPSALALSTQEDEADSVADIMKTTVEDEKTKEQSVGRVNAKRDDANLKPAISFTVFGAQARKNSFTVFSEHRR